VVLVEHDGVEPGGLRGPVLGEARLVQRAADDGVEVPVGEQDDGVARSRAGWS
jgi:hypothetical protein